jgi:hypothetical protein
MELRRGGRRRSDAKGKRTTNRVGSGGGARVAQVRTVWRDDGLDPRRAPTLVCTMDEIRRDADADLASDGHEVGRGREPGAEVVGRAVDARALVADPRPRLRRPHLAEDAHLDVRVLEEVPTSPAHVLRQYRRPGLSGAWR